MADSPAPARPLRVVHVITRLIVGGAQENTLLSCEGQHAAGHDVTLICGPETGPEGSLLKRARQSGIRVEIDEHLRRELGPVRDWRALRSLKQRFRRLQPDVVHTHSSKAGILGRMAAWATGGRAGRVFIVHTIHGLAFTTSTRKLVNAGYVAAEKLAARRCHRIACVATAMAEQSLALGIGRPEQYVTVFSGMDTQPFLSPPRPRDEVRQELGLGPSDVAVVTIARLFDKKGHNDLLDAAPRLCKRQPNLRFVWIGDGARRGEFERCIADMNLGNKFILTGLVQPEQVPELTSACDILAHPSRREGLARAIPQGQLAGLPVVTYAIDGNAEGLLEGESGYAVKPFDQDAFVDHVERFAADAAMRRRFGETGRAFAAERFDTAAMVGALEQLYWSGLAELGRA